MLKLYFQQVGEWSFTENQYLCPPDNYSVADASWLRVIQYKMTCFAAFHFDEVLLRAEICFDLVIFRGEMMSICYMNSAKNHIWV